MVKIIECPRDAWQGLRKIIPTAVKVAYLGELLRAGFHHLDAVSFVSPKHIPQMADSESAMKGLSTGELSRYRDVEGIDPEIIGIVVNEQGFRRALETPGVTTIGYPYSISEQFSRQNANMSREESRQLIEKIEREIEALAARPLKRRVSGSWRKVKQREIEALARSEAKLPGGIEPLANDEFKAPGLVVYISMAFGNPYGEAWQPEMVAEAIQWLKRIGVRVVSLADTVGKAQPEGVGELFNSVKDSGAGMEIGVHLHSRPEGASDKVLAAYEAGCRRFDSALTGLGGCPFAGDDLVGNIPTEIVLNTLVKRGIACDIEQADLASVVKATEEIRNEYTH